METVIIESPYAGDVERNIKYLQRCIRWCFENGYAPFASHQMYTYALDDEIWGERQLGIAAGREWAKRADKQLFFIDYGKSPGMEAAPRVGRIETVKIGKNPGGKKKKDKE